MCRILGLVFLLSLLHVSLEACDFSLLKYLVLPSLVISGMSYSKNGGRGFKLYD